jgi:hypothetical protein
MGDKLQAPFGRATFIWPSAFLARFSRFAEGHIVNNRRTAVFDRQPHDLRQGPAPRRVFAADRIWVLIKYLKRFIAVYSSISILTAWSRQVQITDIFFRIRSSNNQPSYTPLLEIWEFARQRMQDTISLLSGT